MNPFDPTQELADGVAASGTAIRAVDQAMDLVANTPSVSGEFVPSLPGDIAAARADAAAWPTTYRPMAIESLECVQSFATTFDAMYPDLYSLAGRLGDPTAAEQFTSRVSELVVATTDLLHETRGYSQSLLDYSNRLDADSRQLNADQASLQTQQQQAQEQANADRQAAQQMQDQIDDLNIFEEAWDWLTGQLDDMEDAEEQEEQDAQRAQQQANEIGSDLAAVDQSLGAMSGVESSVNSLSNGWEALNGNLAGVAAAEASTIANEGSLTPDLLSAAKADWDNIAQQVATLLGTL